MDQLAISDATAARTPKGVETSEKMHIKCGAFGKKKPKNCASSKPCHPENRNRGETEKVK